MATFLFFRISAFKRKLTNQYTCQPNEFRTNMTQICFADLIYEIKESAGKYRQTVFDFDKIQH